MIVKEGRSTAMTKDKRRKFTAEFKTQVVGAAIGQGGYIDQPSANLPQAVLRQWFVWTGYLFSE